MKKIFLSLAAVTAFGAAAHAQKLGDVFVNGTIGYSYQNTESTAGATTINGPVTHELKLSPSIGYQFDRNWGAGLKLQYDLGYQKSIPAGSALENIATSQVFGIGPFLRYTKHISPMFFINGQLHAMYVTGKLTSETAGVKVTTDRANGVDVGIMPSVGINITRCLAVTGAIGGLGYATVKSEDPSNSSIYTRRNAFDVSLGREFMLGVQWNFATDGGRGRRNRMEPMSETRRMDRYRDNDENENKDEEMPRRRRRMRN